MRKLKERLKMKIDKATDTGIPDPEKLKGRLVLIHSMPRTASTSLRTWLNRQDGMICHGEILGPNKVNGTSNKQEKAFDPGRRNRYPYKFAKTYFAAHNHELIGFKALSSHLLDGRNLAFVNWFFEAQPRVIMLYRDDLVARFKSALYHRLDLGNIDETYILNLTPNDVIADCVSIREQWQMANQYWTKNCQSLSINIKDLSGDIRPDLESLLGKTIEGEMPRSNSASTKKAKEDNVRAVAHVEKICGHKRLDPYRAMTFET